MTIPEVINETDCRITFRDKEFSANGAHLLPCTDGKWRGVVYVKQTFKQTFKGAPQSSGVVTTWHGDQIATASFTDYRGNFCSMRRVSFTWNNMNFIGDYCPDWADACKVRTTKAYETTLREVK